MRQKARRAAHGLRQKARGLRVVACALVAALAVSGAFAARAQSPEPEVRTYVVQPGDSVWSIAAEFYGSGDKYAIIYQYNEFVAKPPFLLKPGQLLNLPILGLGPEAQLDWLLRDVKAKPPRALDWLEARERMNLWRLYRVATGDESAAHIVFEDMTELRLRENALLVIYGASASAARTARRDKIEVMLEEGTIQGGLATLDEGVAGQQPMVIRTPSGQVDLLAKLAQVQAEITASIVSVYDGNATVKAQGAAVDVQGGQGTVVKKGKRPEQARALPEAPSWVEPQPALVAVLAGQTGNWDAAWKPAERAETYRVELGTDASFKQVLFDAEIGAGVTRLRLADLKPGRYAVRVSTRDADKLESRPGAARLLEVVTMQPLRALTTGPDGALEAVGFVQMQIAAEMSERTTYTIGDGPEQAGSLPIRLTTPGRHRLALRSGTATTIVQVHILALAASLEVAGEPLPADAPAQVTLTVKDERGRAAHLPGLVLETSNGQELALTQVPGGYRAQVPARTQDARLAVRARWLGGGLAVRELVYEGRPAEDLQARQVFALTPYRVSRFLPGPLVAPRPESRIAFDTTLAHVDRGPGALALALDGELELGGDVGLGARFVAQEVRLAEGTDAQARWQDLSLMARVALGGEHALVTPYLRVALPVGMGHEERVFGVEPGVLLRLDWGEVLLDARAALLLLPGVARGSALRADALVALTWHPNALASLALSGETIADFGEDAWRNLVGVGVNLHFGDVRLGFSLGLGVGAATQDELGAAFGRVVVDVGLPP